MRLNNMIFLCLSLLSFLGVASGNSFTAKECLDSEFETKIQGKGFLFGLVKHHLVLEKKNCVISLKEEEYFYLKTHWEVDICREPIHLKKELLKNTSVFKKSIRCKKPAQGAFCEETKKFLNILRDVGLIFAEGDRQLLSSSHGKTYCAYLLAKEYLKQDSVFVWGQKDVYVEGLDGHVKPKELKPYLEPVMPITPVPAIEDEPELPSPTAPVPDEVLEPAKEWSTSEPKPIEASGAF